MDVVRLLPADIRSRLRSGVAISSLSQCAEELILNAVDAEATCIAVRIDTSLCKVQVVDNGHGIDKVQLENVATRYATSKCHSTCDLEQLRFHGYRGEALASIRNLCAILEIESRATGTSMTYRRAFQGEDSSHIEESKRLRACVGTTVTVHNLFHNLPVRRRHLDESLEFEKVKRMMEGIALFNPKISFSLRNEISGKMALKTQKCDSIQGTFCILFGLEKSRRLVEVEVKQKPFRFKGYISTDAHSNKLLQYIYINGRLVLKSRIHKVVSWILQKRSIICRRKGAVRDFAQNSSPPRQLERHGVYVLNLECPLNEYDITFDPRKTLVEFKDWTCVLKLLKDLVYSFLRQNNLLAQEDNYKGNWDNCTFTDPVLQEVLDDNKPTETQTENPPDADLIISTENTIGNLQSKRVKRPGRSKSCNSGSAKEAIEETNNENAESFDTVIFGKDLASVEPSLLDCVATPTSKIPGALFSAALGSTGYKSSTTSKSGKYVSGESEIKPTMHENSGGNQGEEMPFIHSRNLNTMLDTLSCEKESRISPDCIIQPPTPTQLFNKDSFKNDDKTQNNSFEDRHCGPSSEKLNDESIVSVTATSRTRVSISLPAHCSKLNSLAMLRDEMKRKPALNPVQNDRKLAVDAQLVGLQKIRAKMMSSSRLNAQLSDTGNAREENSGNLRQTRSLTIDGKGGLDKGFSIPKLRRLAEKMKGRSKGYNASQTQTTGTIRDVENETARERDSQGKLSRTVANDRKRSVEHTDLICDKSIPCKNLKMKSHENLVSICDESISKSKNSDRYFEVVNTGCGDVDTNSSANNRNNITSNSQNEFPVQRHNKENKDEYMKQTLEGGKNEKMERLSVYHEVPCGVACAISTDEFTLHRKVGVTKDLKQKMEIERIPRNYLCETGQESARNYQVNFISEERLVGEETKEGSAVDINYARTERDVEISTSPDNKSSLPNTQIDHKITGIPFKPTVTADFYLEFSPLKFEEGQTASCNIFPWMEGNKASSTTIPTEGGVACSLGFQPDCVESQEFDADLIPSTQPFTVVSDFENKAQECRESTSLSPQQKVGASSAEDCVKAREDNTDDTQHTAKIQEETTFRPVNKNNCEALHCGEIQENTSNLQPSGAKLTPHTSPRNINNSAEQSLKYQLGPQLVENKSTGKESTKENCAESQDPMVKDAVTFKNQKEGPQVIFTSGSWVCQMDPNTGGKVYVNRITGQTSSQKPGSPATNDPIQTKVRRLGACDDAILSGWEANGCHGDATVRAVCSSLSSVPQDSNMYTSFKQWENPMFKAPSDVACYSVPDATQTTKNDMKVQTLVQPQRFTKQMLQTAKVLKQVDEKFILCVMKSASVESGKNPDLLVVLDQHAAHERVRLEQLTSSLCGVNTLLEKSEMEDTLIEASDIDPPVEISLNGDVIRIIKAFKNYVTLIGVEFQEQQNDANKLLVNRVPACLIGKEVTQSKNRKLLAVTQILQDYLTEQAELLKKTAGGVASLPPTIHNILCSQACHGAIRFGDPLTPNECQKLVSSLSECALPFQCAHGRPSCMPLLYLHSLISPDQVTPKKPNIGRLRQRIESELNDK